MKKNILYAASLACAALLFTSCDEDLGLGNKHAVEKHYGEEIVFGGSASYNLAEAKDRSTRTIYGGYVKGADEEPVYWVTTDQVRLFCPDAAVKTADYNVTELGNAEDNVYASLEKITDAGLQWANPDDQHTFYGVYPIPSDNSLKESAELTGTIPEVQDYDGYTTEKGNYVFAPNMDHAYMVAKTVVKKPNEIGESVYLKFSPIATAIEIELTNEGNVPYNFREVHLSSTKHFLSGSFTAKLDNMAKGEEGNVTYYSGCPTDITYGNDVSKHVAVRLYVDGDAVTLGGEDHVGATLKFTVFMLPSTDGAVDDAVDDLEITLVTSDGNKTGKLSGIEIKKSTKNYMHMMPIGGEMTYNQADWLKYVENAKKLNELSIPGAGGASSGVNNDGSTGAVGLKSTDWNSNSNYYEQSLSIEELWNVGIRCFEFTVDKHATDNSKLGSVEVYCNAQKTNMTLDECVTKVKTLLGEHPEEFAMVIITYQQQSGWNLRNADGTVEQTRQPNIFMSQLNTYWTNLEMPDGTKKALYNSDLTVETARGSLFCIARPTSQGEDNYAVISTTFNDRWSILGGDYYALNSTTYSSLPWDEDTDVAENILVIHGWGTLKDKWYVRGYTDCVYFRMGGNGHFDHVTDENANTGLSLEEQVTVLGYRDDRATKPGRPFDVSTGTDASGTLDDEYDGITKTSQLTLTPNFSYSTITNADNKILNTERVAWVQEWARVSKESKNYNSNAGVTYWLSSIDEKKAHITDCLTRSISKAETDKTIYINSLCGYYVMSGTDDVSKLSASANSLTECNFAYDATVGGYSGAKKFNPLTGANNKAGMCGDIGTFATDINTFFLTELNNNLTEGNRLAGSTGIVLMDRVSNTEGEDGAKIPSIIIANNFAPDQNATATAFSIPNGGDYTPDSGDEATANSRIVVNGNAFTITWE